MLIGRLLLWSSLALALAASIAFFRSEREVQRQWSSEPSRQLTFARRLFLLMGLCIALTMIYLWYLILTQRYEVAYVHEYTDRSLPLLYRFAAFWGGQAGTWLLWAFFTTLWGLFLTRFAKPYETAALTILSGLNFLFLLPAVLEDPFRVLHPPPRDGMGLNPLLHNPWMAIHPPNMFIGYASMSLPFALALAGLWRKDWTGWTRYALPACNLAVAALGLGIFLGGVWSYEVLGWGGYWAWDPVENASFVPWLACVALLHFLIVHRSGKGAARLTTFMGLLPLLTVYYATFVTRSGFIQSVHAFGTSPIVWWLLGIMTFLTVVSMGIFALRVRQVPAPEGQVIDRIGGYSFFATMGAIIAGIFGLVVLIGLSLPWISIIGKAIGFKDMPEVGVDRAFYDRVSFPIAIVMAVSLAFMPLLTLVVPKNEEDRISWLKSVPWLILNIGLASALVGFWMGVRQPVSLILIGLSAAVIATNGYALIKRLKTSPWASGAYLAHTGLALFILGVVGSELHDETARLVIPSGQHRSAFGYLLTYADLRPTEDGKLQVVLEGAKLNGTNSHDGAHSTFTATPVMFFAPRFGMVRRPHIERSLLYDIYIEPLEFALPEEAGTLTLARGESATVKPYTITFNGFRLSGKVTMGMPEKITALVEIKDGKKTHLLKPYWHLKEDGIDKKSDHIPGTNIKVSIEGMNAEERSVKFRIEGIDGLTGHSGYVVINVLKKPGVNLVWLGSICVLLGALFTGVRRIREVAKAVGERKGKKKGTSVTA
ncbi:MAG: cytochrome c biogenesis protein CcsA [Armatimonadetes bacterium]|nr:cytochrome c biogenesis protein CcsA [Armatimonadota bacterium]MDW8121337.1 cytochrome c biogenesis protein CcsA [Armatimonadota bacterium]